MKGNLEWMERYDLYALACCDSVVVNSCSTIRSFKSKLSLKLWSERTEPKEGKPGHLPFVVARHLFDFSKHFRSKECMPPCYFSLRFLFFSIAFFCIILFFFFLFLFSFLSLAMANERVMCEGVDGHKGRAIDIGFVWAQDGVELKRLAFSRVCDRARLIILENRMSSFISSFGGYLCKNGVVFDLLSFIVSHC
jgi:hypothetical protein